MIHPMLEVDYLILKSKYLHKYEKLHLHYLDEYLNKYPDNTLAKAEVATKRRIGKTLKKEKEELKRLQKELNINDTSFI